MPTLLPRQCTVLAVLLVITATGCDDTDPSAGTSLDCSDGDADGVCDVADNCPSVFNPNQLDTDGDDVGDACPNQKTCADVDDDGLCDGETSDLPPGPCAVVGGDLDGDGVCSLFDNCVVIANSDQSDLDRDGVGDACDFEECDGLDNDGDGIIDNGFDDFDGDGIATCIDPCPTNPDGDSDGDGIFDCEDPCRLDPNNDEDEDGVCADEDNCPAISNYQQQDGDEDGIGDACDIEECDGVNNDGDAFVDEGMPDLDGDGVCDDIDPCVADPANDIDGDALCFPSDNCIHWPNIDQSDEDADGIGDACDLDHPEACDTPLTFYPLGTVAASTGLQVNDMVAPGPVGPLYVAVGSGGLLFANHVLAIDVVNGSPSVLWSVPLGVDPRALALSDDGTRLYVAVDGTGEVRPINLSSGALCHGYRVSVDVPPGALASKLAVVPGQADIVIARLVDVRSDEAELVAYDRGFPRSKRGPFISADFVPIDATSIFGHGGKLLDEYSLQADGIELVQQTEVFPVGIGPRGMVYAEDTLFLGGGVALTLDPIAIQGSYFDYAGSPAVALEHDELFLGFAFDLNVVNASTFAWEREISLGPPPTFYILETERFGDHLAIRSASQFRVLQDVVGVP